MNYYTIQIHYGGTAEDLIEERKDISPPSENNLHNWINDIRDKIFTTGITVVTSPSAFELISPYRIKAVYLLLQDKKYSL